MRLPVTEFETQIASGHIKRVEHSERPGLFLYNYTPKTQFERAWNPQTQLSRGLVMDSGGLVIAHPFPKFFNFDEHAPEDLPWHAGFSATAKMDGSLFIVQPMPDGRTIYASRGSFTSEQARYGRRLFEDRYANVRLSLGITYLFELIYPENRIVIDYGQTRDLVLIGMYDVETGQDLPLSDAPEGLQVVKHYYFDGLKVSAEYLRDLDFPNEEGFVVRFESGLRVKIKFEEYKRLHRLVTGVSTKTIWEFLRDGKPLDELLDRVPDEFNQFVRTTVAELHTQFAVVEERAAAIYRSVRGLPTRKEQALAIMTEGDKHLTGVVFRMLDGAEYANVIWRSLQPEYRQPFADRE